MPEPDDYRPDPELEARQTERMEEESDDDVRIIEQTDQPMEIDATQDVVSQRPPAQRRSVLPRPAELLRRATLSMHSRPGQGPVRVDQLPAPSRDRLVRPLREGRQYTHMLNVHPMFSLDQQSVIPRYITPQVMAPIRKPSRAERQTVVSDYCQQPKGLQLSVCIWLKSPVPKTDIWIVMRFSC